MYFCWVNTVERRNKLKVIKMSQMISKINILKLIMETKSRTEKADSTIKTHIGLSMGAGFIPLPVADILAVTAIQLDMIRQLARIYDVDFKETQGKAIVSALTGSSLARIGARVAIKLIPGIGSLVGGVAMSVFSGAATYAIGEVFKKHFETGGTFLDFDTDRLKKLYDEKFEKGKKVAEEVAKEKEANKPDETGSQTNTIAKLKELGDLKAAGVLSESEFEELKKKLLTQF